MMRGSRLFAAAAVVVVAASCGARVSDEQVRAAQGAGQSGGGQTSVIVGGDEPPEANSSGGGNASGASGSTSDAAADAPSSPAADAPVAGGDNGGATDVGVTATEIALGNVSTLSGPVPGLFAGAVYGTQAWVAYQNSIGGINGRKIRLDVRDDQFDTASNRAQTIESLGKDFALVGGFSLYDDAAVPQIEKSGAAAVQIPLGPALQRSPNNFAINPVRRGSGSGPWALVKDKFPGSIGAVGALYGDIPAAKEGYLNVKNAMESLGYKFVYERGYQATEADFTADVVRMRQAGVKMFLAFEAANAARVAKAMQAQQFKVEPFVVFGPAYSAAFPALAGAAGEGILNVTTQAMYLGEDAPFNAEVRLFQEWFKKVRPNGSPDLFAAYGWGSGRLFAKAAQDAGPKLTRAALLAALRKIDDWNGYGLFPASGPASKRPAVCFIMVRLHDGKFERWNSPPPGFNCNGARFVERG